ncbi:MAG TPA: ZIP family metal transporter [Thermoanaerobaculaceae bacterium]|nr:ZIP family metal transporter [Thermoanaerobaculaceae bacterium]
MSLLAGALVVAWVACATLAGGAVPLRFERHSRMFLSFSAGTLVGLALLELIPAGIADVTAEIHLKFVVVLAAFLGTMFLDKLHVLHPHPHAMDAECPPKPHEHAPLAMHGALGLLVHSAVDGVALAAALHQSPTVAMAVGLALSAHKFADGLTTVSLILTHHHRRDQALRLLLGNAAALLAGFGLGMAVSMRTDQLGALLLVMAGFFLYLGASDLIPSLTTPVCRKRDVFATACGMAAIAVAATLAP